MRTAVDPRTALLAALLAAAACSDNPAKVPACTTRAQCTAVQDCQGGFCVADVTSPSVAGRLPSKDATNVFWRDPVVVDFDEPIDLRTITDASVRLTDPASNEQAHTYELKGGRLELRLSQPPADPAPVRFTLTLGSQIRDPAGNALSPDVWAWELPTWHQPAPPFNQGVGGGLVLSHAVAPDGAVWMAWQDTYPAGSSPEVKRAVGGSWTSFGRPSRSGSGHSVGTSIAVDAGGHPILAYAPRTSGFRGPATVYVDRHDGSAWVPLGGALNADPLRDAKGPRLRVDSSGRPVVLWAETVGTSEHLFAKRWNGTAWEPLLDETPAEPTRSISAYAFAVGPGGRLSIAFADGASIEMRRYLAGGWQHPGLNLPAAATALDLAVDGDGLEVVVYSDTGGVQAARWRDGAPGAFVALGGPLAASGTNPSVVFRASGRTGQQLLVGWSGGLAGWSDPSWVAIADPPGGTLSANADGVLGSVWSDTVGFETERVTARRFNR